MLLRDAGLTLNLKKCKFGLEEMEYLGFIVDMNGVEPDVRKVRAISEFPTPQDVHDVQRFHGLVSYLRSFVPQLAGIAAPLIELLKNENKFYWGKLQETSFQLIKQKLINKPVLAHYHTHVSRTELHTDPSGGGLGAMLFQADHQGKLC